jgi:hypothetical protein
MILTSNRGFAEWGEISSSPPRFSIGSFTTPSSFKSTGQAIACVSTQTFSLNLLAPKSLSSATPIPPTLKRRGRPPKTGGADPFQG